MRGESGGRPIRTAVGGLVTVGKLGAGLVKAIRQRELPDLAAPDWLDPPARACYELPRSGHWVEVVLDPDAGDWLDRVHAAVPRLSESAFGFEAWLEREAGSLAVHLGERRVGVVAEPVFAAVLDAAEFRDELPYVGARLTKRPPPSRYLLEVERP